MNPIESNSEPIFSNKIGRVSFECKDPIVILICYREPYDEERNNPAYWRAVIELVAKAKKWGKQEFPGVLGWEKIPSQDPVHGEEICFFLTPEIGT